MLRADFQISDSMVRMFSALTGDRSSLHTDRAFARRSMYRRNVVHGMLPVMFIVALKLSDGGKAFRNLLRISARFHGPVFVNDKLTICAELDETDKKDRQMKFSYVLKRSGAGSVLTTGNFIISQDERSSEKRAGPSKSSPSGKCMIPGDLLEKDMKFEDLPKDYEDGFQFTISKRHAEELFKILRSGLLSGVKTGRWASRGIANLLSVSLLSTFAGMRVPGRHATFTDLDVSFHKTVPWDKKQLLKGRIAFKSQSALTLVEDVSIYDNDLNKGAIMTGKISVKVNEPEIKMPSLRSIKDSDSDLRLKDRVVLITGASRGIGETTAKLLSLYGAKVVINYLHGKEDADKIVREIRSGGGEAVAVQANVSDRQEVKRMVAESCKKYGTIDILVNNAVRDAYPTPFTDLTWDDIQEEIDVTVKGAFNCCQEVLPVMLKNKEGKIINISTIFTDDPPPNQAKYVISKNGLIGLTRSLAVEFAPKNIQVNAVVPSIVHTDLSKHVPRILFEGMKKESPMMRNANAVDVAKAVLFLSSSLASYTTGQRIMVTGGRPPFL